MPPSKQTLANLQAADGGRYDRSACLQALLENNGDEELALKTLRNGTSSAGGELAEAVPSDGEVVPTAVTATLVEGGGGGGSGGGKTLVDKLRELDDAMSSGLISEQEHQVDTR